MWRMCRPRGKTLGAKPLQSNRRSKQSNKFHKVCCVSTDTVWVLGLYLETLFVPCSSHCGPRTRVGNLLRTSYTLASRKNECWKPRQEYWSRSSKVSKERGKTTVGTLSVWHEFRMLTGESCFQFGWALLLSNRSTVDFDTLSFRQSFQSLANEIWRWNRRLLLFSFIVDRQWNQLFGTTVEYCQDCRIDSTFRRLQSDFTADNDDTPEQDNYHVGFTRVIPACVSHRRDIVEHSRETR